MRLVRERSFGTTVPLARFAAHDGAANYIDILFDRADSEVIAFDEVHRLASTYLEVYDAVYTPDLAIKFPFKMTKALGALAKALLH